MTFWPLISILTYLRDLTIKFKYYFSSTASKPNDDYWFFTPKTAPLYLLFLLPVVSLKSATFFTKFNSIGTLNIFFLMSVILYLSSTWGINVDLWNFDSPFYVPSFKSTFPSLSGMMALGLFIHNAVITIMKNNRHQENNVSRSINFIINFTL